MNGEHRVLGFGSVVQSTSRSEMRIAATPIGCMACLEISLPHLLPHLRELCGLAHTRPQGVTVAGPAVAPTADRCTPPTRKGVGAQLPSERWARRDHVEGQRFETFATCNAPRADAPMSCTVEDRADVSHADDVDGCFSNYLRRQETRVRPAGRRVAHGIATFWLGSTAAQASSTVSGRLETLSQPLEDRTRKVRGRCL